jgi:hypothetical protein
MPAPIDEIIKRRVVQQWLSGEARDKIAINNNIGSGTVSSIVNNFKIGLDNLDFASFRELMLEAKREGLTPSDLASHVRLYNYLVKSGAAEEEVESFITNVNSGYIPLGKAIELVNQIYEISKSESVPPDQLLDYVKEKLEEKQKIEEEIKQADTILQSKNVSIETINEHVKLNQKLNQHNLSFQDIDKLLKLVVNAKKYGFEPKKIVGKLKKIQRLEKKEKRLKNNCVILSNLLDKHKQTVPLAELIEAMGSGKSELISFKIAVNEAIETYGLSPSAAALHVINIISDHNKKAQLKHELSELNLQKYAINEYCSSRSQVINALTNLQSHGIPEEKILLLNSFLENNGYKDMISKSLIE